MVNVYLPSVNAHLPPRRYLRFVAKVKGSKSGAQKGVPKPHARPLDAAFPLRLRAAMQRRKFVREDGSTMNAALAREAKCTHQVIGQYLNPDKPRKSIDALLLLSLCDALSVTPYYLMLNEGSIDDVPIGQRPMQQLRRRPAPTKLIEEKTV